VQPHFPNQPIRSMQRRLLLFTAALVLPCAAGIIWMLTPAPAPLAEADASASKPASGIRSGEASAAAVSRTDAALLRADTSKMVRRSDDDFPELQPEQPPVAAAPPPPPISARFTLAAQPGAAGRVPSEPNARIRVLPGIAPAGKPGAGAAAGAGAVVLQVDGSLHDPLAWVEGQEVPPGPHADLKEKIADAFAAEVSAAAKNPERDGKPLDQAWNEARTRANGQYQKFFGSEAASRAAISAGRAAAVKQ